MTASLQQTAEDLEFNLAYEVIYHRSRADALTSLHRWGALATIFAGTAVMATVPFAWIVGGLVALIGIGDVVFDPVSRAAAHKEMLVRYLELVERLTAAQGDPATLREITRGLIALTHREPPEFRVARFIAFNKAIVSLGRDRASMHKLPLYKRALAQVWRFEGHV